MVDKSTIIPQGQRAVQREQQRWQRQTAEQRQNAEHRQTAGRQQLRQQQDMPSFSAQIVVQDLEASSRFYQKAFNFKEMPQQMNDQQMRVLECNGLPFLLISEDASQKLEGYSAQSPMSLNNLSSTIITVLCTDIQKMYERAINAGARPIQAPHKTNGGAKTFLVAGIENYVWRFIDNFASLPEAL